MFQNLTLRGFFQAREPRLWLTLLGEVILFVSDAVEAGIEPQTWVYAVVVAFVGFILRGEYTPLVNQSK